MEFEIFPRQSGTLFADDDIAVQTFEGGRLLVESQGTVFVAIGAGEAQINGHTIRAGMYACVPRLAMLQAGSCRALVVESKKFRSMFALGGPVEPVGRLRYINGCTDSGLIQPAKLGDPCLNALFFPAETLQTAHTHPSHRVGLIYDGEGACLTPNGETPMRQGDTFIIPAHSLHWFKTTDQAMRIIVFHPDSEFGPTDEVHQMLEATLIPA